MGSDRTDPSSRSPHSIPVEEIPDPVAGYDVRESGPVISKTNGAFDAAFGSVSTGTTVRRWLRGDLAADDATVDDVCSSLAAGTDVDAEVERSPEDGEESETIRYRLRSLDGSNGREGVEGYCLLTPAEATGERSPGTGVEVDRIASVVSHDLRNPLDVANAHLQAARETGDDEHFDHVKQAHDRMEGIIRDVLTLARGKGALDGTADVDVGSVATDAWETVDTEGASLRIEDDLPSPEADPDRLQRLFENLFRNSVEHAGPTTDEAGRIDERAGDSGGEQPIQIRVGSTDAGFFVADDGIGIPPDERDRVFDPGYTSSDAGNGTGLGLTIVEQIAGAHDWSISVTSGPLDGARFEFRVTPTDP